jgi:hypothetical protein
MKPEIFEFFTPQARKAVIDAHWVATGWLSPLPRTMYQGELYCPLGLAMAIDNIPASNVPNEREVTRVLRREFPGEPMSHLRACARTFIDGFDSGQIPPIELRSMLEGA